MSSARMPASSRACSSAWRRSLCISGLKALSLSGRLSVIDSTPASCETRIDDMGKAYNRTMPKVYSIDGITPVVDPTAYVHPTAVLIGDVIVGKGCYVGPHASLRGDFGRIELREGSNIQDSCVMHSFPGQDAIVEEDGHVGHGAVLHG